MKVAPCIIGAGTKETGETLLLIDRKEGEIIHAALTEYCRLNKRNRRAKRLLAEAENIPVM